VSEGVSSSSTDRYGSPFFIFFRTFLLDLGDDGVVNRNGRIETGGDTF
jgi:hypothetical protein